MKSQVVLQLVLFYGGFIKAEVDIPYIQIDRINDKCSITEYNLLPINCDQPIYPVVHGWLEGLQDEAYHTLVKELIAKNYNSYFVNWHNIGGNLIYITVTVDVAFVGKCLGQYLSTLYQKCQKPYVYLIGHSLGAHVAGNAGRTLQASGFLVDVITGLDPAGPAFYFFERHARLSPDDARLVIHLRTDAFFFGTADQLGDVTFYANNGVFQAGCPFDPNIDFSIPIVCSHQRSIAYQIEAVISNNFVASKCDSFMGQIVKKYPDQNIIYNLDIPQNISGTYCFDTNSHTPYGKGKP